MPGIRCRARPAARCGPGSHWAGVMKAAVVLAAVALMAAAVWSTPGLAADVETVGNTRVQVQGMIDEGRSGAVYHATDSEGKPAVLKRLHSGEKWAPNEIEATKAAKQYIAHDSKNMVQKKVGDIGLTDYLAHKKDNPGGWKPNSAEISAQLEKQQIKKGWLHFDGHEGNVRVDTTKTTASGAPKFKLVDWGKAKKLSDTSPSEMAEQRDKERNRIARQCRKAGFEFRASVGGGGGGVYRRSGSGGACSTKPKTATGGSRGQPAGGTAPGKGTAGGGALRGKKARESRRGR
ncbi:hypothetical protein DFJ73DRAFT_932591 [Zopfochytrium polystomum]|nr:hypothetical protein DFJ73DRAFT_932591 [Zopfochytrium polystomum]